jgi:hypothetical protein
MAADAQAKLKCEYAVLALILAFAPAIKVV